MLVQASLCALAPLTGWAHRQLVLQHQASCLACAGRECRGCAAP